MLESRKRRLEWKKLSLVQVHPHKLESLGSTGEAARERYLLALHQCPLVKAFLMAPGYWSSYGGRLLNQPMTINICKGVHEKLIPTLLCPDPSQTGSPAHVPLHGRI